MPINIRRVNNDSLRNRQAELRAELTASVQERMSMRDFRDLAKMDLLSTSEHVLFSELHRIEFLLGEE